MTAFLNLSSPYKMLVSFCIILSFSSCYPKSWSASLWPEDAIERWCFALFREAKDADKPKEGSDLYNFYRDLEDVRRVRIALQRVVREFVPKTALNERSDWKTVIDTYVVPVFRERSSTKVARCFRRVREIYHDGFSEILSWPIGDFDIVKESVVESFKRLSCALPRVVFNHDGEEKTLIERDDDHKSIKNIFNECGLDRSRRLIVMNILNESLKSVGISFLEKSFPHATVYMNSFGMGFALWLRIGNQNYQSLRQHEKQTIDAIHIMQLEIIREDISTALDPRTSTFVK